MIIQLKKWDSIIWMLFMTALTIYNLFKKGKVNLLILCMYTISLLHILINQKLDQKKISKFTRMKFIKIVSTIFSLRLLRIFFKKCSVQVRDKEAEDISLPLICLHLLTTQRIRCWVETPWRSFQAHYSVRRNFPPSRNPLKIFFGSTLCSTLPFFSPRSLPWTTKMLPPPPLPFFKILFDVTTIREEKKKKKSNYEIKQSEESEKEIGEIDLETKFPFFSMYLLCSRVYHRISSNTN